MKRTFNVVIRTLSLTPLSDGIYQGVYGVGSGIVIDSDPAAEYRECGWKARFLNELRPDFGIFETLRVENGRCALLDRHLCRLKTSAQALNLPLPDGCENQIKQYIARLPDGAFRIKALLASDGISLSRAVLNRLTDKQRVIISPTILPAQNYLRRFKTTCRTVFDQAWQTAETQGAFDSLFFNSDGILLEARQKQRVRQIPRTMAYALFRFRHFKRHNAPSRIGRTAKIFANKSSNRNTHHTKNTARSRRNPPLQRLARRICRRPCLNAQKCRPNLFPKFGRHYPTIQNRQSADTNTSLLRRFAYGTLLSVLPKR